MRAILCILALTASYVFSSCEKDPGEGGLASIRGQVLVQDYNGDCTNLRDEFYGIDEDVFIIAGDAPSYFEKVKTGPDGTFWFPYLRPGKYTVYALSENCAVPGELEAVTKEVFIRGRKDEIVTEDIIVIR